MPRDWKTAKCLEAWRSKEDSLTKSVEYDSEETDSDPEEAAERDYALKNGLPIKTGHEEETHTIEPEKKKPAATKITQAKAARKARCRGVSGSMTKKQKSITHDDWEALYDDDYDFVEPDDSYDNGSNILDENNENHLDGFNLQDFAVNGLHRKKCTSEAASEAELKHHFSPDEKNEKDLFDGGAKIKKISVAVADLKV